VLHSGKFIYRSIYSVQQQLILNTCHGQQCLSENNVQYISKLLLDSGLRANYISGSGTGRRFSLFLGASPPAPDSDALFVDEELSFERLVGRLRPPDAPASPPASSPGLGGRAELTGGCVGGRAGAGPSRNSRPRAGLLLGLFIQKLIPPMRVSTGSSSITFTVENTAARRLVRAAASLLACLLDMASPFGAFTIVLCSKEYLIADCHDFLASIAYICCSTSDSPGAISTVSDSTPEQHDRAVEQIMTRFNRRAVNMQ
jgi:hypothetical protein